MRGSQHAKEVFEFTINDSGLQIGRPFTKIHNIILGIPSVSWPEDEGLETRFMKWHEALEEEIGEVDGMGGHGE
jgi:hypothetical protein